MQCIHIASHCFQKALGFLSENRTLHSKLQMAEVVQRQAHSAEQDYEEVIHLLEAEIAELKMQLAGKKAKHASEIEVMKLLSLGIQTHTDRTEQHSRSSSGGSTPSL